MAAPKDCIGTYSQWISVFLDDGFLKVLSCREGEETEIMLSRDSAVELIRLIAANLPNVKYD